MDKSDKPKILQPEDLRAGDVLLCYAGQTAYKEEGEIGYSHVAISLGGDEIFHSENSVEIASISKLLDNYDHVAIMRGKGNWLDGNIEALKEFANQQVGKGFNAIGKSRIRERKKAHDSVVMERVKDHFDGVVMDDGTDRGRYFCSQLVTAAFIRGGVIGGGAQYVFRPDIMTPGDIAKDKAYGFFQGYLISHGKYKVPSEDWFRANC